MEKKPLVTLQSIAQQLGLSTATVSRAFNHPEKLSASTRLRIEEAVSAQQYQINALPTSSEGRIIWVMIDTLWNTFDFELLQAIDEVAQQHDYFLLLTNQLIDPQDIAKPVNHFLLQQIQGIIQIGHITGSEAILKDRLAKLPRVLIGHLSQATDALIIDIDHISASFRAVSYLCQQGYSRIASISGIANSPLTALHEQGYRLALQRHNIAYESCYVMRGEHSFKYGQAAAKILLTLPSIPNAIYCHHDAIAIGVLHQAKCLNIKIPEQLAVIGFGDLPFSKFYQPPLTSVTYPTQAIGKKAAKTLISWLSDRNNRPQSCYFESEIIRRDTVS